MLATAPGRNTPRDFRQDCWLLWWWLSFHLPVLIIFVTDFCGLASVRSRSFPWLSWRLARSFIWGAVSYFKSAPASGRTWRK